MSTIEVTRSDDEWRAVDTETGLEAAGSTRGHALRTLGTLLDADVTDGDPAERLTELAAETQARFEDENVTESDIEDAIEWARSQSSSTRTRSSPDSDSVALRTTRSFVR